LFMRVAHASMLAVNYARAKTARTRPGELSATSDAKAHD